jgi:hypothetical protein
MKLIGSTMQSMPPRTIDVVPTTIAGVCALLAHAADHACGGNSWPDGYVAENPKTPWDRENGVSWEVFLHRSLAIALPKIASRSVTLAA